MTYRVEVMVKGKFEPVGAPIYDLIQANHIAKRFIEKFKLPVQIAVNGAKRSRQSEITTPQAVLNNFSDRRPAR